MRQLVLLFLVMLFSLPAKSWTHIDNFRRFSDGSVAIASNFPGERKFIRRDPDVPNVFVFDTDIPQWLIDDYMSYLNETTYQVRELTPSSEPSLGETIVIADFSYVGTNQGGLAGPRIMTREDDEFFYAGAGKVRLNPDRFSLTLLIHEAKHAYECLAHARPGIQWKFINGSFQSWDFEDVSVMIGDTSSFTELTDEDEWATEASVNGCINCGKVIIRSSTLKGLQLVAVNSNNGKRFTTIVDPLGKSENGEGETVITLKTGPRSRNYFFYFEELVRSSAEWTYNYGYWNGADNPLEQEKVWIGSGQELVNKGSNKKVFKIRKGQTRILNIEK